MKSNWFKTISVAGVLSLAACNPVDQVNRADEEIAAFHEALSEGDGDAIWARLGPEARASTSRAEFNEFVEIAHSGLGEFQDRTRTSMNVNSDNGVTTTEISMTTTYANGEATEVFIFTGEGEDMEVASWNIDSPAVLEAIMEASMEEGSSAEFNVDATVEITDVE